MLLSEFRAGSLLLLTAVLTSTSLLASEAVFLDESEISWKVNDFNVSRWKTLVGGDEGGELAEADVQFGRWQLAPGATYHAHRHEVPEIYYIISGEAEWTVGNETRRVTAGATILTEPGQVHKMVNLTDKPIDALWFWWAPDGRRKVFSGDYEFTEPAPAPMPGFEGAEKRR